MCLVGLIMDTGAELVEAVAPLQSTMAARAGPEVSS